MSRNATAWAAALVAALALLVSSSAAAAAVTAKALPEDKVLLENEHLRCVFAARDEGSASSLFFKDTGKELAVSLTYNEKRFNAFREAIHAPAMGGRGVRIEPSGQAYKLVRVGVVDGVAAAAFTGYPYQPRGKGEDTNYGKVRIEKTYRLGPGSTRLDIEVKAINESAESLPLSVWLHTGGFRVQDEYIDNYVPGPAGTLRGTDPWVKGASTSVIAPAAAGPWDAAVAADKPRTGLYVAGLPEQIETIDNYLIKFNGFQFQMATRLFTVPAGEALAVPYAFVAAQGITRIDAASRDLAGGIEFDARTVKPNETLDATAMVVSPMAVKAAAVVTLRQLPDGAARELGRFDLALEAGKGAAAAVKAPLGGDGTYVLGCDITTAGGAKLHVERPVVVGLSAVPYAAPMPELAGQPYWVELRGESPLPAWTQHCDRSVRYPMAPWNTPAARPFKVLYIGRTDWSTGMFRDIARRAGAEWDFVNLDWPTGASQYRITEQKIVAEKIAGFQPDVVLTAGLRYSGLPQSFLDMLLAKVRDGMGLVMVGRGNDDYLGKWSAILAQPAFTKLETDLDRGLADVFKAGIGPGDMGKVEAFSFGKGRIVNIAKQLAYYRNSLLPRHHGKTALPDWEYHFAQYVRAMRFAAQHETGVALTGIALKGDALEVNCRADVAQEATFVYDLISTDEYDVAHGAQPVSLAAGQSAFTVPVGPRVDTDYVVHAWLLAGKAAAQQQARPPMDVDALLRDAAEPGAGAVLDFTADTFTATPAVSIAAVDIKDADKPTPSAVTVKLAPGAAEHKTVTLQARIFNGDDRRLAWQTQGPAQVGDAATFTGIAYAPVSADSLLVVRALDGEKVLAVRAQRFSARTRNNFAEDDIAFQTVAGATDRWYLYWAMKPWAVDKAGMTFVPFSYGSRGSFPWKRERGDVLDPPIVDEKPLRDYLARTAEGAAKSGNVWYCLADEFRLGGEYDFSPATVAAFRAALKPKYGTVDRLNDEWGAGFKSFDDVQPILLAEARKNADRPGAWLDFRLFMDGLVDRRYVIAAEEAARVSPLIRCGPSGMYAPSYTTSVNYREMCRNSRLIVTYSGIRSDWAREFMPADGRIGVWYGYGWQKPHLTWQAMFLGYNFIGWWGFTPGSSLARMGMVAIDLTPGRNYAAIGEQQAELLRGLGRLFVHSRRAEPPAYLPYSQASAYVANLLERNYADGSTAGAALLSANNVSYGFVADEDAIPQLAAMRDKLLLFPGIDAMAPDVAAAYAKAIERGCSALADAEVAERNAHGTRAVRGGLDAAFGITRAKAAEVAVPQVETVAWTANAPAELSRTPGQMVKALTGLAAGDGAVWATFPDGTPAIIARKTAAGSLAVLINSRLEWSRRSNIQRAAHPEDEPDQLSASDTVQAVTQYLLASAAIKAPAVVTPAAYKPEFVGEFVNGRAHYYGLIIRNAPRAGDVVVALPHKAHTYDARTGRYFGEVSSFTDHFDPAALAKVYAQLPYKVAGIDAALAAQPTPGQAVTLRGAIRTEAGAAPEYHVIHCDVVLPDGSRPRYYQANLDAPAGKFTATVSLPLNAAAGTWNVELTDAATGTKTTLPLVVN